MKTLRSISIETVAFSLLTILPNLAHADFVFDLGNSEIVGVTGSGADQLASPYATLSIVGNTSTGQVDFTLTTSTHNASAPIDAVFSEISFNTSLLAETVGKHGVVTLNDFHLLSVNGVTVTNQSLLGTGGNVSSVGSFDYTVGGASNGDRAESYTFVLQMTNNSEALASNFGLANADGNFFAAHMFTQIGSNGTTGFIGSDSDPAPVPVPSTLVMSSILFGVLGAVWSCKRLKQTAAA